VVESLGTIAYQVSLELFLASALFWLTARLATHLMRITDPAWRARYFLLPILAPLVAVPLIHLLVRPLLLRFPPTPLEILLHHSFGFSPWIGIASLALAGLALAWGFIQSFRPLAALGLLRIALKHPHQESGQRLRCDCVLLSVASKFGMSPPTLLVTPGSSCSSLAIGPFGSFVLVSEALCSSLDDEELEAVLAHELSHIKRKDALFAPVVSVCSRLLAFSPFAQSAYRIFVQAREEAVDDLAVRATGQPLALASCLVKAWRLSQRYQAKHLPVSGLLSSSGSVGIRIKRLLDDPGATEIAAPWWFRWAYFGSGAFAVALLLLAV